MQPHLSISLLMFLVSFCWSYQTLTATTSFKVMRRIVGLASTEQRANCHEPANVSFCRLHNMIQQQQQQQQLDYPSLHYNDVIVEPGTRVHSVVALAMALASQIIWLWQDGRRRGNQGPWHSILYFPGMDTVVRSTSPETAGSNHRCSVVGCVILFDWPWQCLARAPLSFTACWWQAQWELPTSAVPYYLVFIIMANIDMYTNEVKKKWKELKALGSFNQHTEVNKVMFQPCNEFTFVGIWQVLFFYICTYTHTNFTFTDSVGKLVIVLFFKARWSNGLDVQEQRIEKSVSPPKSQEGVYCKRQ